MKSEMTVYTPQKGRLETISVVLTHENTTWFDAALADDIAMITDWHGDLIISGQGRDYPIRIYDVSRAEIDHNRRQAKELRSHALR